MVDYSKKKTSKIPGHYISVFENISDLTKFLQKPRKPERNSSSESTSNGSWSGTRTYKEAFDKLKYADEELFKTIKKEKSKINIDKILGNISNRVKYEKRPYGAIPNVPAVLIGNPINMINPEKTRLSHRILNIALDMGVCAGVSEDDIIKIGILYLTVIDLLEKKGYRCNLYAITSSRYYEEYYLYMMTRVKTDKEPLNLKKICFPIVNPAYLRRIYFRWCEVFDYPEDITNCSYGRDVSKDKVKKDLKKILKQDFIIWSYNDGNGGSKTIEDIIANLEDQGIKIYD